MGRVRPAPNDHRARKKARRSGREKGVHVYIAAERLGKLTEAPEIFYVVDGGERGRFVVTLYTEP